MPLRYGPARASAPPCGAGAPSASEGSALGYTLLELLMVLVIIGTLATMAIPRLQGVKEKAQIARAIGDVRALQMDIMDYEVANGYLPATLSEIDRDRLLDPWGNPYQYLRIREPGGSSGPGGGGGGGGVAGLRKDRFLVPLNSDFDLYSMGPDGDSRPPLTARASQDDIVRANDGGFVGVAEAF